MSLRAAAPCLGTSRLTHKHQPLTPRGITHRERSLRGFLARQGADSADVGSPTDTPKAATPDPWAASSDNRQSDSAPAAGVLAATVESPSAAPSTAPSAPPSPWDAATAAAAGAPSETAHADAATSSANGDGAASAAASTAVSAAASAASTAPAHSDAGSSSSSSSSSNGSGRGAGSGASGGGIGATPAPSRPSRPAGLSEDTAALLTRLRAELARTSSAPVPMPPRRATTASSSSTTSTTTTTTTTTTTNAGDSGGSGGGIETSGNSGSGSERNVTEPGPNSPPGVLKPPPPVGGAPAAAAAAQRAPAEAAAAAGEAPKPGAAMSKEALAAALAASAAAVPGDEAEPASSSFSSTGGIGAFFGSLLKRRQRPPPAAPAAADAPGTDAATATASSASTSTPTPTSTSTSEMSSPTIPATADRLVAGTSSSGVGGGGSRPAGRKRRAVVVGGGIGGLVSAARLAKEGFSVTLLEANSQVGGRCQSVQRGRFRFDTGPSLLLFIETYRKAFAALGTSLAQQVPVVRVTPAAYRVFFQGAGSLDMLYDVQRMVEQLEGVEKGAGGQYLAWLSRARAALQLGVEGFIERDAEGLTDIIARALQDEELRALLSSVGVGELLGPHHSRMARRFRDPRLRALFTFQDLYVGLSPYNAPGVYSLLAATELTDGVWYPLGGFGQIRDALLRVGQGLGVRVRCGARVAGIRTATSPSPGEGGGQAVTGVVLASGEELEADVVVSNRDVPLTYELLRGSAETHGSATARRLLSADYSAGVISFNWSVNKKLDQLLHHNVFMSGDFEGSWDRATGPDSLARSPNFYVHCPARTDPTASPPGSDSVMVLLPVANIQEVLKAQEAERRRASPLGSSSSPSSPFSSSSSSSSPSSSAAAAPVDYSSLVAAGREAVLRSMAEAGLTDVRQHIVDELVIDPVEWRDRYSLAHGAAFGLSHGLSQLSVFRPAQSDRLVRGLYLVGASTRPGNGVPLTMISADLVTQRVMQDVAAGVI